MKNRFFLILSIAILASLTYAAPIDSVGSVTINGKVYVLYRVGMGESVYSIANKYHASMRDIVSISPEVKKGLTEGMVIKVPYSGKSRESEKAPSSNTKIHIVKAGETLYGIGRMYSVSVNDLMSWNRLTTTSLNVGQKLVVQGASLKNKTAGTTQIKNGKKTHTVLPGEGLYAIARLYNVKVDELISWNKLSNTSLQVGQKLIVGLDKQENYTHPTKINPDEPDLSRHYEIEKVQESGIAAIMEGTEQTTKYVAMHRTASVGAIIAVKNEMNGQMVFVRVVGKLPNTGVNSKIIIRISEAAYKNIGAIDPKFRVELSYLPNR